MKHHMFCVPGMDEEWFRMVHVAIEQQAAQALQGAIAAKVRGASVA